MNGRPCRGRRTRLPLLLVPLLAPLGCGGDERADGFYVVAAQAWGSEARLEREIVVNPLFDAPGNPRLPEGALALLQKAGFQQIGPDGEEDPTKATIYFTPPQALENGFLELRMYVSLGARPGRQRPGDSWWRVVADCSEACQLKEIARVTSGG